MRPHRSELLVVTTLLLLSSPLVAAPAHLDSFKAELYESFVSIMQWTTAIGLGFFIFGLVLVLSGNKDLHEVSRFLVGGSLIACAPWIGALVLF